MSKKLLLLIALAVLIFTSVPFLVKKNNEMLIQGEVETTTVDLSSKVPGRVLNIDVKKGDKVKKGQLLITLDTPEIQAKRMQANAALDMAQAVNAKVNKGARDEQLAMLYNKMLQAQAGKELADKTYKRIKNLQKEGVVSLQKLDEISAKHKSACKLAKMAEINYKMYLSGARKEDKLTALANVKRAKGAVSEVNSYLSENRIKTPISGEVTDVTVEEGELVGSGFPIVTVVNLDDSWITFNLREDMLPKIKMGTEFDVKVPAIGKDPIKVKVNYISSLGNYATWRATRMRGDFDMKTFEVRVVPVNKVDGLRAGMSAVVNWNKI